ncbi:MAG TPA: WD40 repeat domain-containing protein [Gemmata sp.]|nr:WD40 repeat domain-containing protein [Gemmata sp.]
MFACRFPAAVAVAILSIAVAFGADDPYGDPIPKGAQVRLGTARMRSTLGYGGPSALTPDGKFLIAAVPTGGIGFIDPTTGKVTRTIQIDGVFGAPNELSADGARGVIAGYGQPMVCDLQNGKLMVKLTRLAPGGDHGVALSADGKRLAVGGTKSFDKKEKDKPVTAIVWDVDANKELISVTPAQNQSANVAISGNGKWLATWGYHYDQNAKQPLKPEENPSQQIQFWDASSGKEAAKATLPGGYSPTVVELSPDGSVAAVSGGDSAIYLFHPSTGNSLGLLLGRSRQGRKIAFSGDGKAIAAAGADGYIQVWSLPDGKRLSTTRPPVPIQDATRGLQFTGDNRVVSWGIRGGTTAVWEAPSGKLLSPAGGHMFSITGLAVATGGKEIYTSDANGTILRWDRATGKELGTLALEAPPGTFYNRGTAVLSPDGTRALGYDANSLGLYDLPAGSQQFVIPGDINRASRGGFSSDGNKVIQLLTSYDPKQHPARAVVWDVTSGKKLGEVNLPNVGDLAAALAPDGKLLFTAGVARDEKGAARLIVTGWELATGKRVGEYAQDYQGFGSLQLVAAADNKSAVVAAPQSGAFVVDVIAGTRSRGLEM